MSWRASLRVMKRPERLTPALCSQLTRHCLATRPLYTAGQMSIVRYCSLLSLSSNCWDIWSVGCVRRWPVRWLPLGRTIPPPHASHPYHLGEQNFHSLPLRVLPGERHMVHYARVWRDDAKGHSATHSNPLRHLADCCGYKWSVSTTRSTTPTP